MRSHALFNPRKKNSILFSAILIAATALTGCATNPVTGKAELITISKEREIKLGLAAKKRFLQKNPKYHHPELANYVNKIGQRIAKNSHRPDLNYTFTIIDSPAINAFAIYGGHILICRGLLAHIHNEAELAAFLGHEIAHIAARHGAKTLAKKDIAKTARLAFFHVLAFTEQAKDLTQRLSSPLIYRNQPEYELTADALSAQYLADSGYSTQAIITSAAFLNQLSKYQAFKAAKLGINSVSSHRAYQRHPDNEKRLNKAIQKAKNTQNSVTRQNNQNHYLNLIDHIDYGYNEKFGIAVDNIIYFTPENLKITLPANWHISQSGYRYTAVSPDKKDAIKLTILLPSRVSPQHAVNISIKNNGAHQFGKSGSLLNSKIDTTLGEKYADLALFAYNQNVLLQVNAYSNQANSLNDLLLEIENQLTSIAKSEQHLGHTRKIRIITAKEGDTYAKLAKKARLGKTTERRLRLLNRAGINDEPSVGQRIKIIE